MTALITLLSLLGIVLALLAWRNERTDRLAAESAADFARDEAAMQRGEAWGHAQTVASLKIQLDDAERRARRRSRRQLETPAPLPENAK